MEKLTREERETVINYCEADGYYLIETTVQKHINKFDKLGYECIRVDKYPDGSVMCKEYKVAERVISYRSPIVPPKKELSEEEKARKRELIKKLNENRRKLS